MTSHLIHIGFPKTGSNLLRAWFEAHPQIKFAAGGVAGYQDVYQLVAAAKADTSWHVTSHESLSIPPPESGRVDLGSMGEALVRRQAATCELLSGLFPTAHVLMITRGFRAMILSSYSQYVRVGGCEDLETMAAGAGQEIPWDYDHVHELYGRAFGGRVIALPYELLASDLPGFFAELERRLSLEPFEFNNRRLNPSLSPSELRWYPRLARGVRALPFGRRLSPHYEKLAFRNRLRRLIAVLDRLRPAPPVTGELIPEAVLEQFRGMASRLAADPVYAPYAREYLF